MTTEPTAHTITWYHEGTSEQVLVQGLLIVTRSDPGTGKTTMSTISPDQIRSVATGDASPRPASPDEVGLTGGRHREVLPSADPVFALHLQRYQQHRREAAELDDKLAAQLRSLRKLGSR